MKIQNKFFIKNKLIKFLSIPIALLFVVAIISFSKDNFSNVEKVHTAELSFAEHSNDPKLIGKVLPASCASSISATYPNGTGGWTWTWRLGGQAYPRELSYWINHPDFNPGAGPAVTHNWDANGGYHLDGYNQLVPNASCYDGIPKCDKGYTYNSAAFSCDLIPTPPAVNIKFQ